MFAGRLVMVILLLAFPLNVIAPSSDSEFEAYGSTLLKENAKVEVPLQHRPLLLIERGKTSFLAMPVVIDGKVKVGFLHPDDLKLACPVPTYHKHRTHPDHPEKWTVMDNVPIRETLINNVRQKVPNLWRAKCRDEVKPLWKETRKKCHNEAELYRVGFEVLKGLGAAQRFLHTITPGKQRKQTLHQKQGFDWYTLYSVCYDAKRLNTYYTQHVIHGPSVAARELLLKSLIAYKPYHRESSTNPPTQDSHTNPPPGPEIHSDVAGPGSEIRLVDRQHTQSPLRETSGASAEGPETSTTAEHRASVPTEEVEEIGPDPDDDESLTDSLDAVRVVRTKSELDILYEDSQRKAITDIVGENELTTHWDGLAKVLVKGLLVPPGDMPYPSWDSATLFDVNIVPMWLEVAGRNWRKLEEYVRSFASRMNTDVVVYTGTYQTQELQQIRGIIRTYKPLRLREGAPPWIKRKKGDDTTLHGHRVPQYLWKILYLPDTQEGIAFIVHNDPNARDCFQRICRDICEEHGWNDIKSDEPHKGCTYCCHVSDLQKLSKTNFPRITIKKIMNGNTALTRVHSD